MDIITWDRYHTDQDGGGYVGVAGIHGEPGYLYETAVHVTKAGVRDEMIATFQLNGLVYDYNVEYEVNGYTLTGGWVNP